MQVKTTIYDIVGYMIPGFGFFLAGYLGYSHSIRVEFTFDSIFADISSLTGSKIILLAILAYLIGHLLSTVSSLIIEGMILKIPLFKKFKDDKEILGPKMHGIFSEKFQKTFGFDSDPAQFGVCICHVESKQPAIYSTALIFLSFYGMARNLTLIFILYSIWELLNWLGFKNSQSFGYFLVSLTLGVIAFYHYLRFLKYFKQRILTGFVIPETP
jgi:hypothetical protein